MKDKISRRAIGDSGEEIAAKYLEECGYVILERNFTIRGGEIDIIALKNETIAFIEVKTRKNKAFGSGAEAVDRKKISHIVYCAELFLQKNEGYENHQKRFDVIEIYTQNRKINHIKNIDIN